MTVRVPLVLGADGLPQQLQSSDTVAGSAAINDATLSRATTYSSSKTYGDLGTPDTDFVAVFNTGLI